MSALQEKVEHFKGLQNKIMDLDRQLQNAKNEYKAEMKATFGVADGEAVNILDVVELVEKVRALSQ